ncbi:MAG: hypothetical protein ACE5HO_21460 [bacterium]
MPKQKKVPEVGQEIETICTKCKTEMIHVITTIKDDVIKKVMCKGCLTTHVYKEEKVEAAKKGPGRPPSTGDAPKKRVRRRKKDWTTLMADVEEGDLTDYDIHSDFAEYQAIRHKHFGVGVITKVLTDNKIEVVFQDKITILAQNWE